MGTIKTTNIETITGSGTLTLGQSGETINIPSGVTVSGAAANTPYFQIKRTGSYQSISSGADTIVQFNTVYYDDGGYWNSGTYKWTPPAGKYFLNATVSLDGTSSDQGLYAIYISRDGTLFTQNYIRQSGTSGLSINTSGILVANGSQSFDVRVYCQTTMNVGYGERQSIFEGYKIIGA